MFIRLAYLVNYFLRRDIAGRTLYKLPDDVLVVAYPGSGGQWLRRLVANLLEPSSPATEANIQSRVPDLYHVSRRAFAKMTNPRIIFSHECFDPEFRRAIYMVRDPRDVAVAIYEQKRQGASSERDLTIERFVSSFFITQTDQFEGGWAEEFSGAIKRNQGYGYRSRLKDEFLGTPASWGENVMSWIGARGHDPNAMLLLRYEDFVTDPHSELRRIAEYLNVARSPEQIQSVVAAAQTQAKLSSGQWKASLPEIAVQSIESVWGSVMTATGYALQVDEVEYRR
jgi:hypothetical protein